MLGLPAKAGTSKVRAFFHYEWASNKQGLPGAYDTGLFRNNSSPDFLDDDQPRPVFELYRKHTNPGAYP